MMTYTVGEAVGLFTSVSETSMSITTYGIVHITALQCPSRVASNSAIPAVFHLQEKLGQLVNGSSPPMCPS